MWSFLTTSSFINPLPSYVENKAGDAEKGLRSTKSPPRLVRFDHIDDRIVNANDDIMRPAVMFA
jgi:hypothetical protein